MSEAVEDHVLICTCVARCPSPFAHSFCAELHLNSLYTISCTLSHSSPVPTVTNFHKLGGLRNRPSFLLKTKPLLVLESEVTLQRRPSRFLGGCAPPFPVSLWGRHLLPRVPVVYPSLLLSRARPFFSVYFMRTETRSYSSLLNPQWRERHTALLRNE